MGEGKKTAAFFDLDGTLFQGHFWCGVVKHHVRYKVKLPQVSSYIATHIPLWLAHKLKLLSQETYQAKWAEDLAIAIKGFDRDEGLRTFDWISNNYVMKLLRSDTVALLNQHRNKGHIIVLISGSFTDFLETVKQKLGIDYVVGTKLEVIKNVYTGRIVKPLCLGVNKARLLTEFISQAQLNIDLGLSFAYADSILDAQVLEMVGNPIATYPDRKLLNLAQCRGWQILPLPTL